MEFQEEKVTKLCSFYVSDWHLVTMLLPYINKELNEGTKIATVLEKDIKENVHTLVERLNLKNEKRVLALRWTSTNERKYTNVSKILEENFADKQVIIVNGTKDFINRANENIEKYIKKNEQRLKGKEIKIVNCYEVVEFNGSIVEILDSHDKMLNTSGEKEIKEIFEDYEKKQIV